MQLDPTVIQFITTLGAAGALLYVLKLLVDGKLHTDSEVQGLRADKEALLLINTRLGEALDKTNEQVATIVQLIGQARNGPR